MEHHGAVACNGVNFVMAMVAICMNLLITGSDNAGNDYEYGVWKMCKNGDCQDYATDDIGLGIDMFTLKALYTTAVVCLFVGNCFAGSAYSVAHAKGASLVAFIFS